MNDLMLLAVLMENMFGKKIGIMQLTSARPATREEAQQFE